MPSATLPSAVAATRSRGTGTILGVVFTDWNGNRIHDPGEEPLENIPVAFPRSAQLRRDVMASSRSSAPVEKICTILKLDRVVQGVPEPTSTGVRPGGHAGSRAGHNRHSGRFRSASGSFGHHRADRSTTRRVSFGLIPLGSIRGRVVRDANGNGRVDPGEEPIDGVILVLDRGARSEQVRKGAYRFDSIRRGDHVVSLIQASLPRARS